MAIESVSSSTAPNLSGSTLNNQNTTDKKEEVLKDSLGKELKFTDIDKSLRAKQLEEEEKAKAVSRKKGYDKDMFVKLFVAQMKNQDPMEPMKNEQYMTQMSQFTSVEQITNMATSFEKFAKAFETNGSFNTNFNTKMDEFLKEFKDTNKALLERIESLENEIKKLKA